MITPDFNDDEPTAPEVHRHFPPHSLYDHVIPRAKEAGIVKARLQPA